MRFWLLHTTAHLHFKYQLLFGSVSPTLSSTKRCRHVMTLWTSQFGDRGALGSALGSAQQELKSKYFSAKCSTASETSITSTWWLRQRSCQVGFHVFDSCVSNTKKQRLGAYTKEVGKWRCISQRVKWFLQSPTKIMVYTDWLGPLALNWGHNVRDASPLVANRRLDMQWH